MAERRAVIASKVGLHARPAAVFVKAVQQAGTPVTIAKGDDPGVDAASILNVLTLNAACGDEVVLRADGDGAEQALDELVALLVSDLDA
ncbi:MAG TPA: HPr family phosphocarrier protein [Actinomycetales bacterium]|nr:HPr family phosphocarrier protein [Actinomycetales bacterium]